MEISPARSATRSSASSGVGKSSATISRRCGFSASSLASILYSARAVKRLQSMQLRAPAKINLSFRILRRREDGFHEIETLMAPVSLFDSVTIAATERAGVIDFVCDDASLPNGDDNLVVRAARIFLRAVGEIGLRIELQKQIPHGAGLA